MVRLSLRRRAQTASVEQLSANTDFAGQMADPRGTGSARDGRTGRHRALRLPSAAVRLAVPALPAHPLAARAEAGLHRRDRARPGPLRDRPTPSQWLAEV